jgi:hypothetical protein
MLSIGNGFFVSVGHSVAAAVCPKVDTRPENVDVQTSHLTSQMPETSGSLAIITT